LGLLDAPLIDVMSEAAPIQIASFLAGRADFSRASFAVDIIGVVWAINFSNVLARSFHIRTRSALRQIGCTFDRETLCMVKVGTSPPSNEAGPSCTPQIELDLHDRFVLHKPAGWEVDTTDAGSGRHLSQYLQSVMSLPIAHDASHSYGLLHRLDMPSSGLILIAKTFEAYYDLKLQLSIGEVVRDYVVVVHSAMNVLISEINEKVFHWRHEGNLPSIVCRTGKPSHTFLVVMAHCSAHSQDVSLIGIRIRTGRRHQIRTHARYVGHPTVCDGKYTSSTILFAQASLQGKASSATPPKLDKDAQIQVHAIR